MDAQDIYLNNLRYAREQNAMSNPVIMFVPTEKDVAELNIGDRALNPFGRWAEVTEISFRGVDIHGFQFVGFYTSQGPGSTISGVYKVGDLVRTVGLRQTSDDLDGIQAEMNIRKLRLVTIENSMSVKDALMTAWSKERA